MNHFEGVFCKEEMFKKQFDFRGIFTLKGNLRRKRHERDDTLDVLFIPSSTPWSLTENYAYLFSWQDPSFSAKRL